MAVVMLVLISAATVATWHTVVERNRAPAAEARGREHLARALIALRVPSGVPFARATRDPRVVGNCPPVLAGPDRIIYLLPSTPRTRMTPREQYLNDGYLIPLDILTPAETSHHRGVFDRIEQQIGKEKAQFGVIQRHLDDPDLWALASHPKVLDAAEIALGPDVVLVATHFFVKYPDMTEKFVAWHQDVTYWGFDPAIATTVWLAIDDVDIENGCMRVLPGSHKRGQLPHGKSTRPGNLLSINQEIPHELIDESAAIDFPLRAGQASLHDGLTVHGSNPNRSRRRRCGMTIRFTTPEVKLAPDQNFKSSWAPMLLRGKDRFGRTRMLPPPTFAGR